MTDAAPVCAATRPEEDAIVDAGVETPSLQQVEGDSDQGKPDDSYSSQMEAVDSMNGWQACMGPVYAFRSFCILDQVIYQQCCPGIAVHDNVTGKSTC